MSRLSHASCALLTHEQWQVLVEVLDGDYDQRKLEHAQDVLTRAAPRPWLEEAEAADEDRRAERERQDGEVGQ